jgi:cell fate (sporulation/competence/biofilm development) regulator YlbF (YheA/YmcA/DUF963 family)
MNPYDAANNLAKALGQSAEYKDFQEVQAALKNDPSARVMLIDFRTEQLNLQRQQLSGVDVAPEQEEKLEKLFQVISMNLTLKRFLEAEYRLGVLLQDIQKIIAEATGDLFDPELFGVPDELTDQDEVN